MMSKIKKTLPANAIHLFDLPRETAFTFQGDSNPIKDIYWFLKIDGMYGQVFSTKADMKAFNNPAFVSAGSIVVPEVP